MEFLKCEKCGNVVVALGSREAAECCGESMKPVEPNTQEAAFEKHIPDVTVEGSRVTVQVGSVEHPMLPEHHIEWILLETQQGFQVKKLQNDGKPEAVFYVAEGDAPLRVYESCNLHGLWAAEIREDSCSVKGGKKLVAYFSASGVTAKAAEKIAEAVCADVFEIRPAKAYTAADLDWTDRNSRSTIEMTDASSRPEMADAVPDISGYDVILIGYPIWWGVAPRIINTFIEKCRLDGKTVVPFATSGGSGAAQSEKALRDELPKETALHAARRITDETTREEIEEWLADLS